MNLICGLANIVWLVVFHYRLMWMQNYQINHINHINNISHPDMPCPPCHVHHAMSVYAMMVYNIIPLVVFINGILYHVVYPTVLMKWYDIVMNCLMISFINYYTHEKAITVVITMLVAWVFYWNQYLNSNFVHVCFVNFPLVFLYLICI
jgi:hypothetical protein